MTVHCPACGKLIEDAVCDCTGYDEPVTWCNRHRCYYTEICWSCEREDEFLDDTP